MRRVANICLAIGGSVAVLGVAAVALGLRPSALPPALLDIAAFKLVFLAAGGLIVAGALLGRVARGRPQQAADPGADGRELPAGAVDVSARADERVYERRKHRTP